MSWNFDRFVEKQQYQKKQMTVGCCVHIVAAVVLLLAYIPWSTQRSYDPAYLKATGCHLQKSSFQTYVYVTVSSLTVTTKDGNLVTRQLEVNWDGQKAKPGDQIALYNVPPPEVSSASSQPMVIVDAIDYPEGFFRTDIEFPFTYFNLSTMAREPCLGYWVAYFSQQKLQSSSCLKIRPFWMQENRRYLQSQTLASIMIPGSHDSGCFNAFMGKSTDTLMRYKYAQDEPIFNQLAYGLRYFDFRVGYYPKTTGKYFINHSFFRTDHSLKSILSQVKSFLDATQEIVILDFHLFPVGFDKLSVHQDFMKLIYTSLEPYIIPYSAPYTKASIGELWAKNKRVLISYNNKNARKMEPHGILWPGIPRAWGNKQHPEDLRLYFENVFEKPVPNGLWASMAELTPNARFIITHPRTGLRSLANDINRNVTRWFQDKFWDKANIVATDYFLGNNLIDVAVETNRLKAFCLKKRSANSL